MNLLMDPLPILAFAALRAPHLSWRPFGAISQSFPRKRLVLDSGVFEQRGFHVVYSVVAAYGVPPRIDGCELLSWRNHSPQATELGKERSKHISFIGTPL